MNLPTTLALSANGKSVKITNPAGSLLFEITLSIAEVNIILALFEHQGEIISKESLIAIGWAGKPVSSSALTVAISNIRSAIRHTGIEINNVPRMGYLMNIDHHGESCEEMQSNEQQPYESILTNGMDDDETQSSKNPPLIPPKTPKIEHSTFILRITGYTVLFMGLLALIISIAAVYFYDSVSIVCHTKDATISCESNDADFNIPAMSIDFDVDSLVDQLTED